jgi:NAD(P)-dependent dehydrogenase (short-subunit alcohol dehydrogenase family)
VSIDWSNQSGLVDNCVVVTGAAGGIGAAIARGFASAGAKVLCVDRPESKLAEVQNSLTGAGHQILEIDLTQLSDHSKIFQTAETIAPFVALVHCAAVLRRRSTVDEVTEEDWDTQIDVNLKSTFFLNRTARDAFKRAGRPGSIVNFSSQGWWSGGFGGSVVYAASKGGVVSMTKGLARSFAPDQVRVNALAPGGVDTDMMWSGTSNAAMDKFIEMIPMGRLASPNEMVGGAVFLSSNAASYITGTVLNISGGQLMY